MEDRKWCFGAVRTAFDPKAGISHNASIARLYLGLLFSSAAEQESLQQLDSPRNRNVVSNVAKEEEMRYRQTLRALT